MLISHIQVKMVAVDAHGIPFLRAQESYFITWDY